MEPQFIIRIAGEKYTIQHNKVIGTGPLVKTLKEMYHKIWTDIDEGEIYWSNYIPYTLDFIVEKIVEEYNGEVLQRPKYEILKNVLY